MSLPGTPATAHVDQVLREYLLFRGFVRTLQSFDLEQQNDKLIAYDIDKVKDRIFELIDKLELAGFLTLWKLLADRFFVNLDDQTSEAVANIEKSLQRLFLVKCVRSRKLDKVSEFLRRNSEVFGTDASWQRW
mmetsp:Transcript_9396/g.25488  ORF Transcript_9396/g.25488 Transcript_9396/m.25488 type:complete len:133 (+) Transcript_9396:191-589(+)